MAAGRLARSLAPTPVLPAIAKRKRQRGGQSQFRVWIEEDRIISERGYLVLIKASGRLYLNAEMDLQGGNVPIGLLLATDRETIDAWNRKAAAG